MDKSLYEQFVRYVKKAEKILIISHRHPDADTLGAAIALKIWLKRLGKDVVTACIDEPSQAFSFLPYVDEFVNEFELRDFDLMVVVDAGASYMTNFENKYANLFNSGVPVINIDHHSSNDNYGTLNIVDASAPSTTVILYRIFEALEVRIDEEMASALLAGIYGDTGSFMHSNTTGEVYKIASDLMAKGGQISGVIKNLFKNNDVTTLRLWGLVMEKAKITGDGVIVSVVREADYDEVGAAPSNLSGVIDFLNMVPGTKFAMLVNEDRKGNVKGSFRTRNEDVNLSEVAARFGGGGHPKASGFSMPGKLKEEVRYVIVEEKGGIKKTKKSLDFSA